MSSNLTLSLFAVSILIFIVVLFLLRKGRIPLKFALIWFIPDVIIFVVAVFPQFLSYFTNFLGFQTISNMITGLLILILIFVCIALTVIVSGQKSKITLLIQELSILKKVVNEIEEEEQKYE